MDLTVILAVLCLMTAAFGIGFTAGRNHEKREERVRMEFRRRYER